MSSETKENPFKGYNQKKTTSKSWIRFAPNRFWKFSFSREAFKFFLYVSLPVVAGVIYANPDVMKKLILTFRFIEYPSDTEAKSEIEAFNRQLDRRDESKVQLTRGSLSSLSSIIETFFTLILPH